MAPVRHALRLLEEVDGRAYRERLRFFRGSGASNGLLFLLMLLEAVWLLAMLYVLPPFEIDWSLYEQDYADFHEAAYWLYASLAVLYFPLAALTTLLYVACGFMFYLNRRIISEGWALALDLQALAARLPALLLAAGLAFAVLHAPPAQAVDAQADKAWVEARVNDAQRGPYEMRIVPRRRAASGGGFGELSRILLIGGALALAAWLFVIIAPYSGGGRRKQVKAAAGDSADLHVWHDGKAPPRDAALEQWHSGNMIAALAVLYARLVAAPERHRLPAFIRGESESEYLQRAQPGLPAAQQQFLRELFALWQRGVYGHETLAREAVRGVIERYLALWQGV